MQKIVFEKNIPLQIVCGEKPGQIIVVLVEVWMGTEIGDINGEVSKAIASYIILIYSEVRMNRFSVSTR